MVVRSRASFGEIEPDPGDREHAAAGDASVRIDAGVETQRRGAIGSDHTTDHLVDDGRTGDRCLGIAGGRCDHRECGLRANDHGQLIELALGGEQSEFGDVGLDEGEHGLGLGIAEADVVLDQTWAVGGQHQAGEDHADIGRSGGGEVVEHRLDELGDEIVGGVGDRCRRIGAHAAGVRAGVTLAEPLVVLCQRQGDRPHAVAQRQQRTLGADEAFFEQERPAGRTDRRDRGVVALGNADALAGCEAVELDDHRSIEFVPPGDRSVVVVEGRESGSGIPSDVANSRANVFDDSSRASSAVGPKHGIPRRAHSSATPAASAASGPGNTRSVSSSDAFPRSGASRTSWP